MPAAASSRRVPELRQLRAPLGPRMSHGRAPTTARPCRRRPTRWPTWSGLVARRSATARRRDDGDRLRLARRGRLPRLPPRRALVRPLDRRRRGVDHPHPRALPLKRPRAYVDIPYIALVLGALVSRPAPAGGWPVLALLALAGFLRPEAWLFSFPHISPTSQSTSTCFAPSFSERRRRGGTDRAAGVPLESADTQNAGLIRPAFVEARGTLVALIALALAAPLGWALMFPFYLGYC